MTQHDFQIRVFQFELGTAVEPIIEAHTRDGWTLMENVEDETFPVEVQEGIVDYERYRRIVFTRRHLTPGQRGYTQGYRAGLEAALKALEEWRGRIVSGECHGLLAIRNTPVGGVVGFQDLSAAAFAESIAVVQALLEEKPKDSGG